MYKTLIAICAIVPFLLAAAIGFSLNGAGPDAGFLGMFLFLLGVVASLASASVSVMVGILWTGTKFDKVARAVLLVCLSWTLGLTLSGFLS